MEAPARAAELLKRKYVRPAPGEPVLDALCSGPDAIDVPRSKAHTGSVAAATVVQVFVLGIDPGLTRCGYAVLEAGPRGGGKARSLGVITTDRHLDTASRLAELQHEFVSLFDDFSPTVLAVERVFFQNNLHSAVSVAQAAGLAMAEGASRGLRVMEYSPSQIKAAVAGDGRADKKQMQQMVQTLLGLRALPSPADAADAAAVALCHLANEPFDRQAHRLAPSR